MKGQICAVVVTFNRKALLFECLDALFAQRYPLAKILVVDNASTDGTTDALKDQGYLRKENISLLGLERNLGGAGGFHHGFRWAYENGYEWIWAMDDDTIVQPNALAELFRARKSFTLGQRPDILCSAVNWTDGAPHPMNRPWPKVDCPALAQLAQQHGVNSIRAATFVALLLHRGFVEQFGLPIADYFIWSDDIEYTGRVLRHHFGVAVPASLVLHKTAHKYTAVDSSPARFYYHVRNTLWMLTRSSAWTWKERRTMAVDFAWTIASFLKRSRQKLGGVRAVLRASWDGLFTSPDH